MRLEDLKLYQESLTFSNKIWTLVSKLNDFEKEMIGKKLINAADAISSNLAQGYGRYYFKEKKQFCYESRSFILEAKDWLNKAKERGLVDEADFEDLIEKIEAFE
jgi:four helix bundle protein